MCRVFAQVISGDERREGGIMMKKVLAKYFTSFLVTNMLSITQRLTFLLFPPSPQKRRKKCYGEFPRCGNLTYLFKWDVGDSEADCQRVPPGPSGWMSGSEHHCGCQTVEFLHFLSPNDSSASRQLPDYLPTQLTNHVLF